MSLNEVPETGVEPMAGFNSGGGDGNCVGLIVFMFLREGVFAETSMSGRACSPIHIARKKVAGKPAR
jgi:hypothetical protein